MKTTGGTAISNEAGLVFELRDAKKKVEGKAKISIQDFFKGKRNFDAEKVDLKLTSEQEHRWRNGIQWLTRVIN